MNSPVTASKPTWMVCSKSEGEEISGRSLSRSFFLPPAGERSRVINAMQRLVIFFFLFSFKSPFSEANMEMILFLDFLSSGTDGSGRELWLADCESLGPPPWLLILTGGAGGLSSHTPLSHIYTQVHLRPRRRRWQRVKQKKTAFIKRQLVWRGWFTASLHPDFFFFFWMFYDVGHRSASEPKLTQR